MPGAQCEQEEIQPRDIRTEVFLMPAAVSPEKAGSVSNTHVCCSGTTKWSASRVTAALRLGSSFIPALR